MIRTFATGALLVLLTGPDSLASDRPAHPRQLVYGSLGFEIPKADPLRHELTSGVVVYVAEDHALPLVDIHLTFRVGAFLEGTGQSGVASTTAAMLRQGGTESLSAEAFDERVDFLAASISSSAGVSYGSAHLDCLSGVLDESLDLFFEMLTQPRFDAERLEVLKSNALEGLQQRNDHPGSILSREWGWLLRGAEHPSSRELTGDDVAGLDRDALVAFHRRYWHPRNMVVAVSGDVETASVLAELEARFAAWAGSAEAAEVPWPPPAPGFEPTPGLYHVEKEIPQGRLVLGHATQTWQDWGDPEVYAAVVMNDILGGGGFTSRLVQRIRSDEGLAYSASSSYSLGLFWPGTFQIAFQSKNSTVGRATAIALEEIRRLQSDPVSDEELAISKASFVETFPQRFDSAAATASLFAVDEIVGRPHDYWYHYRDRIQAVDAAAVLEAARRRLKVDELVALVVGPWAEIAEGEGDEGARLESLLGPVTHLPERDPVSLEPRP